MHFNLCTYGSRDNVKVTDTKIKTKKRLWLVQSATINKLD